MSDERLIEETIDPDSVKLFVDGEFVTTIAGLKMIEYGPIEMPAERLERMREEHKQIGKLAQERARAYVHDRQTFDAMAKMLESIELRGFPIPIVMWLEVESYGTPYAVTLVVEAHVRERNTGDWIWLRVQESQIAFHAFEHDPLILVTAVRYAVVNMCQHEIDECLHVAGVRVRDPHRARTETKVPELIVIDEMIGTK
ncbi:MAG: hypothetical protein PVSMB8_00580 [Vulcanimicrobiaceae bacterium]